MRTYATARICLKPNNWQRLSTDANWIQHLIAMTLLLLFCPGTLADSTSPAEEIYRSTLKPLHLFPEVDFYPALRNVSFLEDPSSTLILDDILDTDNQQRFKHLTSNQASFSHTDSAYWLRFQLTNMSTEHILWHLSINYALLDTVSVYFLTTRGVKEFISGDSYPFSQREVALPNFIFPLEFEAAESAIVYIRVQSSGSINVPMTLIQDKKLIEKSSNQSLYYGIYYGSLFVLILYNLLVFSSTRINSFFFNAYYMFGIMLFMLSMSGYAYQYLWPNSPQWSNISIPIFEANGMLAIALFGRSFLGSPKTNLNFKKAFNVFICLSFVALILALTVKYSIAVKINTFLAMLTIIFVYWVGIVRFRQGYSAAKTFILAWSILLVSTCIYALGAFAVIPDYYANEVVMLTGTTAQIIFLNFALAQQTKDMSTQLVNFEKRARERLQQQVDERTTQLTEANIKLETLNKKLEQLSIKDDLTQIANRRYFNHMFDQAYATARRDHENLSLLFLDIDHFKKLNDQLGHQAGDECLKFITEVVHSRVHRPKDFLARYGGEEFAIILPDTDLEGAENIANSIISAVREHPFHYADRPYQMTVSIGVYSAIPSSTSAQSDFLINADTAMYAAKQAGRNRVSSFK